ncbi:MAG: SDR family oxidoreductase [Acidobacteria bacterium]|jgi:NAD(P)-dependent dehydrogenase (short-subunit alcohol dehydrogenase family)|nr:SDR family oxidoreductase [Acidobacteriota bacterium]
MPQDPFRLEGRHVAVVGAGSGIGEAIARACAAQGARVACLDIDEARASAVAEAIGAAAHAVDITDGPAVARVLDALDGQQALDGLVCTPSINVRKPLLQYQDDEFDRVIRINLKGNFNVLRAAGRIMVGHRKGSIVLISSIRAKVVEPGQSVYAATKAGVLQLARGAACEFGPAGVRVNALAPGVTETPLTEPIKRQPDWFNAYAAKSAFNRWAQPHEMAWPTVFLLSDASSFVTGTLQVVDGGWLAMDGRFTPPGM